MMNILKCTNSHNAICSVSAQSTADYALHLIWCVNCTSNYFVKETYKFHKQSALFKPTQLH